MQRYWWNEESFKKSRCMESELASYREQFSLHDGGSFISMAEQEIHQQPLSWGDVRCLHVVGNTWIKRNQENQWMSNRMLSTSSLDKLDKHFICLSWFFAQHQFHRIFCENRRVTATEDLLQESLSWSWLQIMESLRMQVHEAAQAWCSSLYSGILHLSLNPKFPLDFGDA